MVRAGVHYSVGGLAVQASFPVPGWQPLRGSSAANIEVTLADGLPPFLAGPLKELCQWPGRYGVRLFEAAGGWLFSTPQNGSFAVARDGRTVNCIPTRASGSTATTSMASVSDAMCQVLMRRILPRVVQLHGRLGLHGASIVTGDGAAFLVLGPSGAGKSTLAVALQQHLGWDVLSDDISLVEIGHRACRCFPVVTGACLWPDSLGSLSPAPQPAQPLPDHAGKFWRHAQRDDTCLSASLKAVVFLEKGGEGNDEVRAQALSASQGLRLAMRQLVRFNPRDDQALPGLMEKVNRLCDSVPALLLNYPRRYELLPAVTARLRQELAIRQ